MYDHLPHSYIFIPYTPPEYSSVTVLHANLPPPVTPSILSPHAIPNVGIGKFLYV